jgi:2-iminobutanoate/2-iminopropanoate deaminase
VIRAASPAALPRPRFRYSPVIQAGPWTLFSGMIALDVDSGALEPGGAGPETAKILANLGAALPELGLSRKELASARIFTTRFEEFPAINAAWEAWLGDTSAPPARTSVGASALPLGAAVEIEFAFYKEDPRE